MFDATTDDADTKAFAERCEDDRHHFRFHSVARGRDRDGGPTHLHPRADGRRRTRPWIQGSTGSRWIIGTPTTLMSTSSSAAAPTTAEIWSSAVTTSAADSAPARRSASRWNWARAASRKFRAALEKRGRGRALDRPRQGRSRATSADDGAEKSPICSPGAPGERSRSCARLMIGRAAKLGAARSRRAGQLPDAVDLEARTSRARHCAIIAHPRATSSRPCTARSRTCRTPARPRRLRARTATRPPNRCRADSSSAGPAVTKLKRHGLRGYRRRRRTHAPSSSSPTCR